MLMAAKPYGESPIFNGPYVDWRAATRLHAWRRRPGSGGRRWPRRTKKAAPAKEPGRLVLATCAGRRVGRPVAHGGRL